jgi:uncharacterized membrane protein YesL
MQSQYTGNHYESTPEDDVEETPVARRVPGPLLAVGRTLRDWWRDLVVLGLACFAWGLLSLTIVGGPPAAAAVYVLARAAALHEQPDTGLFISALRTYFLRSWGLALVSVAGIAIWIMDLAFYLNLLGNLGIAGQLGAVAILYIGIVWLLTLFYAWPLMICRGDLKLAQVVRNAFVMALRFPGNSIVVSASLALLALASFVIPPLVILATPALIALLGFHNLVLVAPELAPDESEALDIVT